MKRSLCLLALLTLTSAPAAAQRNLPFTGYELAVTGTSQPLRGHPMRVRGTAYRVRGLAELVRHPGASVRARFVAERTQEAFTQARADAQGHFEIAIPIPREHPEHPALEIELGEGDGARTFTLPISTRTALDLVLRLDRELYEPGEPIHVWALLRDLPSGRPLAGERVRVVLEGPPLARVEREITTGPDGVASFDVPLDAHAPEGWLQASLRVGSDTASASARVGMRTYDRVFATLRVVPDEAVAPSAQTHVEVAVTTPSGAPVVGAGVELHLDARTTIHGVTDPDGVARFTFRAPAYLTHDTGVVSLHAEIMHPAHGSVRATGLLRLAVPLTLQIEATPRLGGGLVPEVDDVFYLVLADGSGQPPPAGTAIEVEGAAVRGGRARVVTDANGIAEVQSRLPAGAWAPRDDSAQTSLFARIQGPLERTARLSLPGARDAEVAPRVLAPLVEPGAHVEVAIARAPSAARSAVVVELADAQGILLASRHLAPGAARASFDLPRDRMGLFSVLARSVKENESAEGTGAFECFLVRPASPAFVELVPEREQYLVGERARVELVAPPATAGAAPGFAAILVRDLAAHAGERPFEHYWLGRAFDRALLDPASPAAETVLRTALAAHSFLDEPPAQADPLVDALGRTDSVEPHGSQPSRGTRRDPFPLARELERRGAGAHMLALEQMLAEALANDALDEVTAGTGAARRFRRDLLDGEETLGGGLLTVDLLEAVDASFDFHAAARRLARLRLVRLLAALAGYLDPGDDASVAARMAAREPPERWLPRMVERGLIAAEDLCDPWGGQFQLRRTARPALLLSVHASGLELASPGRDGRIGTADDVRDPFARAVTAGTPYAVASGEDALMQALALLSPFDATILAITEAYSRITAEMTEEEIGDAVHAGVSEGVYGLGLRGTGAGGGGSGFGYGRGGLAPQIRMGSASVQGSGGGVGGLRGLARVLRQRFPATLLFRASIALDPSGRTPIEVPLADAVTSYLIEAVAWRPDGWIWSTSTRIRVDREIVVEAPVPEVARIGDAISLPIRVGNRGDASRSLNVRLLGDDAIGLRDIAPAALTVPARDAAQSPFVLRPTRAGEGQVRVAVASADGTALDAVQLPMRVIELARRVRVHEESIAAGEGEVRLQVPAGASAR
ncbi:MAG: hypothetical protein IT378_21790, partial [Sandaracinaceae bacterium]|nr:hypothetical protein [Sandaracinaceae bacterium]